MTEYVHEAGEGGVEEYVIDELLSAMDTDYITCDPQPKHMNAIFEQLRAAQRIFASEFHYSSPDVAILAGQQFANRMNEYFEQFSKKDRVLGIPAALSRAGISSSHMTINYSTGEMVAALRCQLTMRVCSHHKPRIL